MKTKVVFSTKAILRESDISRVSVNNDQIQELTTLANICQMSLEYSIFFRSEIIIPCEILNLILVRKEGRQRGIPENNYGSVGQKI